MSEHATNCSQLKPVPCGCGGEAVVHEQEYGEYEVYCPRCFITTDDYDTEAEAIEAWNRAMGERKAKATRKPEAFFYRCECGYGLCCEKNDMNYCPHCGGRLEWNE